MPENSFKKAERLSSRKAISTLFQSGSTVYSRPLRVLYSSARDQTYPALVAFSVPKRLFRKAVHRNLLKRRLREAYRLNKSGFYDSLNKSGLQCMLVIQYQGKTLEEYRIIESALKKALEQVVKQEVKRK